MITYEEFLKQNNIEELTALQIKYDEREQDTHFFYTKVTGNPEEYVDVVKSAKELKFIHISQMGDSEYYKSCKSLMQNSQDNVSIYHGVIGKANKNEFLQAEEIIEQVVKEIDCNWTEKQKLAFVHYKMGELISYFPDFNFVGNYKENADRTRNIWKSVLEGRSVCNGVVMIARNILSRVGVKTQELSSGTHSFLLTETEEGNIITDPTWDLNNTLFQARPMYFGITYEQLRQIDGMSKAHKLEREPEDVVEISEKELREIYYSIGLTNEDRKFRFPILEKINNINERQFDTIKDKIDTFLDMYVTDFPKEATHLSETRIMIEGCLQEIGIDCDKLKTRFVYLKSDEDYKNPILAIHISVEGCENIIKMLDLEKMEFVEIEIEEFDKQYRQHEDNQLPRLGEGVRKIAIENELENKVGEWE